MKKIFNFSVILILGLGLTGCAYRSESGESLPESINLKSDILITEQSYDHKNCKTIEHVDVSVKKLTVFHKDPTKEQADFLLSEKAKKLNANVVRNVKYSSGIGFTTWGYLDAQGDASKCDLK